MYTISSKMKFNFFLVYISIISVKSLDVNENSDELEIYRHLFTKLNQIKYGTDNVQRDLLSIKERLNFLENNLYQVPKPKNNAYLKDIHYDLNTITSAVKTIDLNFNNWTIIQRRKDGSENFYRDWNEYKNGFGDRSNEFFIGLEELHHITSFKPHELLIVLEDFDNSKRYASYDLFEIGSEAEQYALKSLGCYSGNAGDSLSYHKGSKFSTKDHDNDQHPDMKCAERFKSAWWFKACHESNLNGCYSDANLRDPAYALACGIHWRTFRGRWYSLKSVEIMIRPK